MNISSLAPAATLLLLAATPSGATTPAEESELATPRPVPELLASAESLTLDEYVSVARQFDVPAYRIVDHDVHVLSKDQALTPLGADFGEPGLAGTIDSGLLMNTSDEIVFIAIGDSLEQGYEPFRIRPGELIAVRMIDSDDVGASGTGCRVACTDGYFACCSFGDCSCNKNELEPTAPCPAGGPHATGCFLGTTDTPVRKRRR